MEWRKMPNYDSTSATAASLNNQMATLLLQHLERDRYLSQKHEMQGKQNNSNTKMLSNAASSL